MSRLLQRDGLTILEKTSFPADTCPSERQEEQNKMLSALAARPGSEDSFSWPGAPGPYTTNLDFLRKGSET